MVKTTTETRQKKKFFPIAIQLVLTAAVIGCSILLARYFLDTKPKIQPKKRISRPPIVQIQTLNPQSFMVTVSALGTVTPARKTNLTPRISGEVISVSDSFIPGGFFKKNDTIAKIDLQDYELEVERLDSDVAQARQELELEMGNQRIAEKEFELLGEAVSEAEKKLILRTPQLSSKKAALSGAVSRLKAAKLNLKRTHIKAPYNGVIQEKNVTLGSSVNQSTTLATFIGTDKFWLKLQVPTEQLQWLSIPNKDTAHGSRVKIFHLEKTNSSTYRTGQIIRLSPSLEEKGRMAVVYVAIEDPLCQLEQNKDKNKLLLSSFVQAEIEGKKLDNVFVINRNHLRQDDTLWLLGSDNKLEIRKVRVKARLREHILLSQEGIFSGEKMIISHLSSPNPGSQLSLAGEKHHKQKKQQKK